MDHHQADRDFSKISTFFECKGDVLRLPYSYNHIPYAILQNTYDNDYNKDINELQI